MNKIEKLKTTEESNLAEETVGEKFNQFRNKINEIIDCVNTLQELKIKEDIKSLMEEIKYKI
jgi:hypothetical protein